MSHWQLIILFCHPHFGMPGQRIVVLFRYPSLRMFRPIYPFRVLRRLVTGHKPGNCPSYSDPSPGYAPPAIRSRLIAGHENRTSDPWADLDSEEKSMRAIKSILDIVLVPVTFYILVLSMGQMVSLREPSYPILMKRFQGLFWLFCSTLLSTELLYERGFHTGHGWAKKDQKLFCR